MSKKNYLLNTLTIMMVGIVSVVLSSCGDDDEIPQKDPDNTGLISTLKSNKWITQDSSYGEGSNYHAWVDIETWTLYFTSDNAGVSYWVQKDYDTDLGNTTTKDYTLFNYQVSGNEVSITYEDSKTMMLYYQGGYLTTKSGGTIFVPSQMTSSDYQFARGLGPKTGSCGNELKYTYDDRTKKLVISGTGRMNDYSSSNQPWHDFAISEITIEHGCTYIGTHAFHNMVSVVDKVSFPSSIQEFGDYSCCDLLISKLLVPTEVVRFGKFAFSDCKSLRDVNFAGCDKLTDIDDFAFAYCPIVYTYFTLPNNVKNVGIMAFASSSFKNSFALNDKIETIGDKAFASLTTSAKIETLIIPNSVKSIGQMAFSGNIGVIKIGTGLRQMGDNPFWGNSRGSMYVNLGNPINMGMDNGTYKYIIANNDGNVTKNWTLYVPKGSKTAYQNAAGWKEFKSINEDASLTSGNGTPDDSGEGGSITGTANGHDWVDLGLSVKWATCNVGANKPSAFGDHFAWGETSKKSAYDWDTYQYYEDDGCIDIGADISGTEYDVAHEKWGGNWCMPTKKQVKELFANTTSEVTTLNGVTGLKLTANNGGSIFLPHSGAYLKTELRTEMYNGNRYGQYWTSTVYEGYPGRACYFSISNGYAQMQGDRCDGYTVRPVLKD